MGSLLYFTDMCFSSYVSVDPTNVYRGYPELCRTYWQKSKAMNRLFVIAVDVVVIAAIIVVIAVIIAWERLRGNGSDRYIWGAALCSASHFLGVSQKFGHENSSFFPLFHSSSFNQNSVSHDRIF